MKRRSFLAGLAALAAPAIIRTPGLLMPIRPILIENPPDGWQRMITTPQFGPDLLPDMMAQRHSEYVRRRRTQRDVGMAEYLAAMAPLAPSEAAIVTAVGIDVTNLRKEGELWLPGPRPTWEELGFWSTGWVWAMDGTQYRYD